ncbi:MAG TPA: DUF2232 domain-containing protein [Candidatus Binataceae bacterium]
MTGKAIIGMIRAAVLSAAFFLAGGAIPIVGGIAMMFAPVPILIYAVGRSKTNWRALSAAVVAAMLIAVGTGVFAGLGYLIVFGLATVVICYLIERQQTFERIVLVAATAILAAAAGAALAATGSPDALIKAIHDQLAAGMAHGQELYKVLGMQTAVPADTQASILAVTMRLCPALAAILAAATVLFNLRVCWRWVGPQRISYSLFGDLLRWSVPEWMVWVLLAAGFGLFIPLAPLSDIALNIFICAGAIYFCQGLAIMAFYFQALAVPAIVRGVIYFVTFAQPVVAAIVCVAGVFDMWIDFRRLKPPSQEAGTFNDFL